MFMPGGAPAAGGWTMYPPLVLQTGDAFPFLIFAVHFHGRLFDCWCHQYRGNRL